MSGLFGGSAKTDRTMQLKAGSDLSNVFNFALPFAQEETGKGGSVIDQALSSLGLSSDYFKKLLSGDRAATAEAVAPVANAATQGADAAKRNQFASGTARGGGTAAVNQQTEDTTRATVDNAIAQVKPLGAEGELKVGATEGAIGSTILSTALGALGIGGSAAKGLGDIATNARATDLQQQNAIGSGIANIALAFLGL